MIYYTFINKVQINKYDAKGLRHEIIESDELAKFIYSEREVVREREEKETDTIRIIKGNDISAVEGENYHHAGGKKEA